MASVKRKAVVEERPNKKSKATKVSLESKAEKPSKDSRKQDDSSERRPVAKSVLVQEERAFPRGGASVLTPLEHRQIKAQAERDVLFEQRTGQVTGEEDGEAALFEQSHARAPAKGKSKKSRDDRSEIAKLEARGPPIHGLSFKNLTVGSVVLGCVTSITSRDVTLALSNNINGYVPITAISEILNARIEKLLQEAGSEDEAQTDDDVDVKQLFFLGQWLRATVTATTSDAVTPGGKSKRHIELTIDPRSVNGGLDANDLPVNGMVQASVRSVEDHGIVMDFGLADTSVKGFVSKKELGAAYEVEKVQEGQVMMCLVTGKGSNGSVLKLSPDAGRFSAFGSGKNVPSLHEAPTVNAFQPGTAVDILVTDSGSNGVAGKIMGMVDVTADIVHCNGGPDIDLHKKYKVGSKTKARIIWTLPKDDGSRKTGVSLLEHTIVLPPPSSKLAENASGKLRNHAAELDQQLPLSSIVAEARITQVLPERGVFMALPSSSGKSGKSLSAFANLSQLSDTSIEAIAASTGPYRTGSVHKARVMAYNPIDNLYYVALKQSILEQQFLRLEDLTVGAVVKGSVEKLILGANGITGVVIRMSDTVSGLIPEIHLSDTQLQHPERKFKEGSSATARVLSVDMEKRQVRLTCKKSLINDEGGSLWQEYEKLEPGMESQGTVMKLLPTGAIIQFFGKVRAFLPVAEMSDTFIENPEHHFRLGQTLKVRILSVNPELEEMRVSCKDDKHFETDQLAAWESIQGGELLSGTVVENTADSVTVDLDNGLRGLIRLGHASDRAAKAESALKKLHVGRKATELLVLGKLNRSRQLLLTKKASMIADAKAGKLLRSFSDIREAVQVHGFVRNVTPEGVYVEFANALVGLLPKREIPQEMLDLPAFGLLKDHSIEVWVVKIEHASSRFVLSMREPTSIVQKASAVALPLSNPVDPKINSVNDFTLGMITKARIASVKSTQINVRLADKVLGRIDMSEAFDSWDDIQNKKCPLQRFKPNEVLDVKILGIHDSKNHRYLPISHRHNTVPVFELTAKRTRLEGDESALTITSLKEDASYVAFINNYSESFAWANISPNVKGRIGIMDLSNRPGQITDAAKSYPVGCAVRVNIKQIDLENNHLELSASDSSHESLTLDNIKPGMILAGRVTRITDRALIVELAENILGSVSLMELSDNYDEADLAQHKKNGIVRVSVLEVDLPNKRVYLSLRPSKVLSSNLPVKDPQITNHGQLKAGELVRGFVKNVGESAVYVQLGAHVVAMARVANLSDDYVKDWKGLFQVDQLVKGRIIHLDSNAKQVHLSLKASDTDASYVKPIQITDIKVGAIVTGNVRKVEDFGAFIDIDNTRPRLSGLCHRTEMAAKKVEDARTLYSAGDKVKAKVLKVDVEARKISLGLKAAYFVDEDEDEDEDLLGDEDGEGLELDVADASESDDEIIEDAEEDEEMASGDDEASEPDAMELDGEVGLKTTGFDWTGESAEQNADDAVSDAEIDVPKSKKRKRKPEIKEDLTGDLDKFGPRSVDDFERQLLGQPNDSQLWIQYMAFQLELSEVQKARDIAERALRTIHIRELEDKANVWTAWLNLEVEYGDEDRVEEVFKRAYQVQDPLEMHEKLASIYISSGKLGKADAVFEQIAANKTFRASPQIWINYANFLMDTMKDPSRARALLTRAMQSIPIAEHRQLTAKFASMEFHSAQGDAERGRTIFEGLISEWPKWTSGWDMFIDLERSQMAQASTTEAKEAGKLRVRGLYERAVAQKMKQRRAKFVFKKWLEFEEAEGNEKTAARVKALAKQYVERQQQAGQNEDDE